MLQAVLFDMDGTLLPMEQNVFAKAYFSTLAEKVAPCGYEPKKLIESVWAGTAAMVANDSTHTNETVFWKTFAGIFGEKAYADIPAFDEYYRTDFQALKDRCGFIPAVGETIRALKASGLPLVLASNPVFPMFAQQTRMRWAGVDPTDFVMITAYENMHRCKPNPAYYTEIAERLSLNPANCLMVGNDVREDMVAASAAGMQVFLIEGCVLNKDNQDISGYPKGTFADLLQFVKKMQ
ncbi:MAG: HAD family hydrolase [Clostridia bacterium]|nr:HAD family hydrolase [Clostridia bacterium]